jgi:hypothetical protein
VPQTLRSENLWKQGSCDDDGDEKGEVMVMLCAIVMLFDPSISVIDIFFCGEGRRGKVGRKGGSVETVFYCTEVEGVGLPGSGAVGGDCDIISECLWLDQSGEGYVRVWDVKKRCGGVLYSEMAPVVVNWENKLATTSTGLRAMGGDELYIEDCESEEEHFV